MAFYKQDIVDINLNTGNIFRSFLPHSIGYKDDDADRFGIRAFRDGEPVDLSGVSCQAIFMNPNGTNIALTSYGTVSGNVAYVTLPPACYDYEGQFCLAIKLVGGGVTGTVRIVDGTVTRTGASGAVAPTASVPTYQEILSTYDAMVAATSAANLAIAETFDATKAYPAGKYVINEGHLYRLTADHAANVTWANTSKVATNFGDDLTELKSALHFSPVDLLTKTGRNNTTNAGITFTWNADKTACTVNGTVSGSVPAAQYFQGSTTSMPTGFKAGETYHVKLKSTSNNTGIAVYYYKNNGTYFTGAQFRTDTTFTIPSDATGMLIFVFVPNGKSVSNDVVSDFGIFKCETNEQISERVEQLYQEAKKSLEDGSYMLHFMRKELTSNQNKTYTSSQIGLATEPLYFENQFLKIVIDIGYKANVYFCNQNNNYVSRSLSEGTHFFYAGKSVPVVFDLYKDPLDTITVNDEKHITVTDIDTDEVAEIGCGIVSHPLEFDTNGSMSATYLYTYNSNDEVISRPIKIPKSGLRIGYNEKYHSKEFINGTTFTFPQFRLLAVKKGDNGLSLQTDNEDILAVSQSVSKFPFSVYVPYVEDCYIFIVQQNENTYTDALYVTSGEVEKSFCGVYNIFPTALRVVPDMTGFTDYNSLDIFGAQSDWYSFSSMLYYATVLRLCDVRKIICSPKYTIMAEIYKTNNDGSITRYGDVWGTWYGSAQNESQINTSGLSVIDFSKYDFDGFALVAIQSTVMYKKDTSSGYGYNIKRMTTGNLGGYEDAIENVCVDYKNGVTISKVPGMPSILEENIHRLMNWKIPEYGNGFYVEQASTTPHYFPPQYDCVPSMYAGTYVANSMLMQITAKSALTCLKNRNGRMRKMQRVEENQPGTDGIPTKGTIGFGLTCTNFTSVIRGLKENYESTSMALQDKLKFDTYDFDYKHDMEKLRPGDVLTKHIETPSLGRYTNSHCMTVESIIEVNGVVKAINIIEATIPYCRRATYIDEEYYMSNENWIVKMYTIDKLADYKWINRIKPEYLKPITQVFDMYPESTEVGTVMCDRGTGSIYGCHTKYIELSFKDDDTITNLYVYKTANGSTSLVATIPTSGANTVNGLQLINIYSNLPKITYYNDATDPNHEHPLYKLYEGLYTVKTAQDGDVQETFYVKGDVDRITYTEDEVTTNLTIPNFSSFVWMEVWNSIPTLPDETEGQEQHRLATRRCRTYTIDDFRQEGNTIDPVTNTGTIHIPRYQYNYQGEQEDISSINRVYETDYGTYWATMSGRVSSDYYRLDDD